VNETTTEKPAASSSPTPADFLVDPLTSESRKTRRDLLVASSVGLLVAWGGLVPTRISALGIDLSLGAQKGLTCALAVVVLYLTAAFVSYGLSDYFNWRLRLHSYRERVEQEAENWTPEDQERYDEIRRRVGDISWLYERAGFLAWVRVVVDMAVPPVLGLAATLSLGIKAWLV
jgi:hypothetical protein